MGRIFGILMQNIQKSHPSLPIFSMCNPEIECVTPGTYALVGAAAVLAGVTRMTVSLTVIMFELTGALTYILPIMITVMVSKTVGDQISRGGIYDKIIKLKNYPFLSEECGNHNMTTAGNMMTQDLKCIQLEGNTVLSLRKFLQENNFKGYPILSHDKLFGFADRLDLIDALDKTLASDGTLVKFQQDTLLMDDCLYLHSAVDNTPTMIHPRFPTRKLSELFRKLVLRFILVTRNGKLEGLITKKDLLQLL
jgi:chloride channel 3/4/5